MSPEGGFDSTQVPKRPNGYTMRFTFHRAENLPMADMNALSSDPYILAQLNSETPSRHKEDPHLRFRTATIRKNINPIWDQQWVVANVPASGFKMKLRVYDEDPNDKDDRLGNVHVSVPSIDESWRDMKEVSYEIKKRSGSKRAYLLQAVVACFSSTKGMGGHVVFSVENLGRTPDDGQNGRLYTVGPSWWTRHYSPLLGRIANRKEPDTAGQQTSDKKIERYNFQSNQMQLSGPVPSQLYHRYVEFKPWVKRMFTSTGIQGFLLGKALHHQHSRVYHFDRGTVWGRLEKSPSVDVTKQFLDLVHFDQGGRIFTYVLTLDALFRFTETGKEFGIDMLSKHTMHSDVSIYIAFSGEFFVRRVKHPRQPPPPEGTEETSHDHPSEHKPNVTHPPDDLPGEHDEPATDPSHYELVIDNDSGTYRPNAALLPKLKEFLSKTLPGIHIMTLDCQADAEKMAKLKQNQRDLKKREGNQVIYRQGSMGSIGSSVSSSDIDELEAREQDFEDDSTAPKDRTPIKAAARDAKLRQQARLAKAKRNYKAAPRDAHSHGAEPNEATASGSAGPSEAGAAGGTGSQ
ncbi:hypothetical protein K431DRAFT_215822 [Polychaeton citri CBS 116435]|uniref:C2 domain-containing protein n=1 Tax=Polychaeton citri CBS 116435 TaxID=1314669 RepID=A0A9P4URG5_9PEZI|nr:hypothetical protein K431DRAFT_215822 [Polychaeton citri CBS 116435]